MPTDQKDAEDNTETANVINKLSRKANLNNKCWEETGSPGRKA